MSLRCAKCDATERGEGWWGWKHDRRLFPRYREAMLREHFPYTCGVMFEERGYWYPWSYVERLRADGEFG
jgi:hypothetical protein